MIQKTRNKSRRKYRRNYSRKSHNKRFTRTMRGGCSWIALGTYNLGRMKATAAETMAQNTKGGGVFYYGSVVPWYTKTGEGIGLRDSVSTKFFISKKDKDTIDITGAGGLPLKIPAGSVASKYMFMLENGTKTSSIVIFIDSIEPSTENPNFLVLKSAQNNNVVFYPKGAPVYDTMIYTLYYNVSCPMYPPTGQYSALPFYVKK